MNKLIRSLLSGCVLLCAATACTAAGPATVYFTSDITPESLLQIYNALGRQAHGKVAVKLSTGEPGGTHYLSPQLIAPLVQKVNGTIVECNTAYRGKRADTASHLQAAADHGFTAIAPVQIMDANGQDTIPVHGGRHLRQNYIGKTWRDYDFTIVLSHFKGHQMAGMGGAMKNISIGIASAQGKSWIHTAGTTTDLSKTWKNLPTDTIFQESMAEASKSIVEAAGPNILYINVANNLSVDCDCSSHPAAPQMADIGIFASLDPVALDQACLDAVRNSPDPGKNHLIQRIESRSAPHNLHYAEQIGVGTRQYRLIELKK